MRKRISAWLLVAALVASMLVSPAHAVAAILTARPPGGAIRAGDTFTVPVDISGNPGFNAVQFTLSFDKSELECTEITQSEKLDRMLSASNPNARAGAIYCAASVELIQGDGRLVTFTFVAKTDIDAVDVSLTVQVLSGGADDDIPYVTDTVPGTLMETPGDETTDATNGETTPVDQTDPTDETTPTDGTTPEEGATPTDGAAPEDGTTPGGGDEDPNPVPDPVVKHYEFTDIGGHWGESWIIEATSRGLFTGYPDGGFHPNEGISRGDFVLVLYRMAGQPETAAANPFADVPENAYYAKAVAWAYANGYVNGRGDGFDPTATLTRQEAMKIIFSLDGAQSGMELMFTSTYDAAFSDSAKIASWAKPAMYWAVFNEIINGAYGALDPEGSLTRVQMAKILVSYGDYEYQNRTA